ADNREAFSHHEEGHSIRDVGAHAIVDSAASEDDLRVIADFLGAVSEIIWVHADAMAADEAGGERKKVPLCGGGAENVLCIQAELMKDDGELVHQSDVEVSLGILDDFGRLCDLDRGRAMGPRRDYRCIKSVDSFSCLWRRATRHFRNHREPMGLVARVDTLWAVTDKEILIES